MKTAVIFIGLLFALVAADEEKECPIMTALKQGVDECVKSLEPSEETLKLVASQQGDDLVEVQCFQACMMNKAGLMENAKMNIDKMEELLRSAENPDEAEINKVIGMLKSCKAESEVSEDECEVAGNYSKCAKAKKEMRK